MAAERGGPRRERHALVLMVLLLVTGCYFPAYDFNGSGTAGLVSFNWTTSVWYTHVSGSLTPVELLAETTGPGYYLYPVAGDYDGDGRWEPAVLKRPVEELVSEWITHGRAGTFTFAAPTLPGYEFLHPIPVPGRYQDGPKTVPAWYRDIDGMWFIQGQDPVQFGTGPTTMPTTTLPPSEAIDQYDQDVPVPEDYDGDGRTDLAVYNPVTGVWRIRNSRDLTVSTLTLGGPNMFPAPADYDGLRRAQPAVFNAAGLHAGRWTVAGKPPVQVVTYTGDHLVMPAPGNYDGSGKALMSYVEDYSKGSHLGPPPPVWHMRSPNIAFGDKSFYLTPFSSPVEIPLSLNWVLARLTMLGRAVCQPNGISTATC